MERARKMILVPEGSVAPVAEEKSLQTSGDNFSRLDTEMYDVLHSKEARDDYEKCLNYLQILRCYLYFRGNERDAELDHEPGEIEETLAPLSKDAIHQGIPKAHTRKARLLLRHWRTTDPNRIKWDNAGTVSIDNQKVPHTDIIALILDTLRKKSVPQNQDPAGRVVFAKFLKTSKTLVNLIENPKILKIGEILTKPVNTAKQRLQSHGENISPVQTRSKKRTVKKWLRLNL